MLLPKSFTIIAPATLNRSLIWLFISAFSSICLCAMAPRREPTRLAGMMNAGSTTSEIAVSRHSSTTMVDSVVARTTMFETTLPRVEVTAVCAPITSLFSRLMSAPVCVRVKNAIGMRCTFSNSATRRS